MNPFDLLRLLWHRRELRTHYHWAPEQIAAHRETALRELRDWAYAHSPFYQRFHKGLYDAPLAELPVLTKQLLMEHYDELVTDRAITLQGLQQYLNQPAQEEPYQDRYWVCSTSGSSGLRGIFPYDAAEWQQVLLSYSRVYDWAGVPLDLLHRLRVAVVSSTVPWHQSARVGATAANPLMPTLRVDSTEPPEQIVARLNDWQPACVIAYAGMARWLALEQLAGRLHIQPQYTICASEVLTADSRALIRRAFGHEPTNTYAATETAGIASECAHHRLHLYEDLFWPEVVDEQLQPATPGTYGHSVLVSVFFTRTLPLIRYQLNDSVMLSPDTCPCGLPYALVAGVQGRSEDILQLPGLAGQTVTVHPNVFHVVLEPVEADAWQVVQLAPDRLEVGLLHPRPGLNLRQVQEAVTGALREKRAQVEVQVQPKEQLIRGALGKSPLIKALVV